MSPAKKLRKLIEGSLEKRVRRAQKRGRSACADEIAAIKLECLEMISHISAQKLAPAEKNVDVAKMASMLTLRADYSMLTKLLFLQAMLKKIGK